MLFPFKGMLYAQWQSSAVDEDAPDTRVFYIRSANGKNWLAPVALTEKCGNVIKTSGGWCSDGEILVAYINVWPAGDNGPTAGFTEYITSSDGITWQLPLPVTDRTGDTIPGIIEQDVHALPGGRLLAAFHIQPGLVAMPYYTDNRLGESGWRAGKMDSVLLTENGTGRAIEPGWFYRRDSAIIMVFRDQAGSYKKLVSVSYDNGSS